MRQLVNCWKIVDQKYRERSKIKKTIDIWESRIVIYNMFQLIKIDSIMTDSWCIFQFLSLQIFTISLIQTKKGLSIILSILIDIYRSSYVWEVCIGTLIRIVNLINFMKLSFWLKLSELRRLICFHSVQRNSNMIDSFLEFETQWNSYWIKKKRKKNNDKKFFLNYIKR